MRIIYAGGLGSQTPLLFTAGIQYVGSLPFHCVKNLGDWLLYD